MLADHEGVAMFSTDGADRSVTNVQQNGIGWEMLIFSTTENNQQSKSFTQSSWHPFLPFWDS